MTWSAPSERTSSRFAVLHTPVTSAPNAFAMERERADATGRSDDQHVVAGLDPPASRSACSAVHAESDGGGLLEGEVRRLRHERVVAGEGVLGEGSVAGAEDLVAG